MRTPYLLLAAASTLLLANAPVSAIENATSAPAYDFRLIDRKTARPAAIDLPDTAGYSLQSVRAMMPKAAKPRIRMAAADDLPHLRSFAKQAPGSRQAIVVAEGVATLDDVLAAAGGASAERDGGAVVLRRPLLVMPGAHLVVDGRRTPWLKLDTAAGAYLVNGGGLWIVEAKVTSWDAEAGAPSPASDSFRPFIAAWGGSRTYVAGAELASLGYPAAKSYGLTLSTGPGKGGAAPTGWVVESRLSDNHYAIYTHGAQDAAFVGNDIYDNIRYGIHPHSGSTGLIIARNTITDTLDGHGIGLSRAVTNSLVFENHVADSAGYGVMIDRDSRQNVVAHNSVRRNRGDGISVLESTGNVLFANDVSSSGRSGIRLRNAAETALLENAIKGSRKDAVRGEASAVIDSQRDLALDPVRPILSATVEGNKLSDNLRSGLNLKNFTELRLGRNEFGAYDSSPFAGALAALHADLYGSVVEAEPAGEVVVSPSFGGVLPASLD
ncbi:MAG TPA: right-handed parallel beta-helix repeat-containing protein [Alphaproteobacteria bacterium]|nr:right-handed parallel beta-helix repeat-containing protein [Alphaproteobacteria bacterium]